MSARKAAPPYGDKRDYPKIDIFGRFPPAFESRYICSTTWARTCREAVERWRASHCGEATKYDVWARKAEGK